MLLIRRLWLLPALILAGLLFLLWNRQTGSYLPYGEYPTSTKDGLLHWTKRKERYPVPQWIMFPRGRARKIPRIQYEFEMHREPAEDKRTREERRDTVKASFVHAWNGYKKYAWAKDEVAPVSGAWRSTFGGWGATLVDTMDTLWIMDLKDDFDQCVEVVKNIDFTTNTEDTLNVFETTIRYLGGLLAAYDLTDRKNQVLLKKARELGDILYTAFDTPNRMPAVRWQWRKSAVGGTVEASRATLLAELGSLTLEFTRLGQLTGDYKFYDAVARVTDELEKLQFNTSIPGLWPTILNAVNLTAHYNHFTFGGMADSTYEYLPKQHILMGAREHQYRTMYEDAINIAERYMFFRPLLPNGQDVLVSGNIMANGTFKPILDPQGQHLTCFASGMIAIGAKIFGRPDDLNYARRLIDGCLWAYDALPSGLMPETFHLIPCHVGVGKALDGECDWTDEKWYEAVAARQGGGAEMNSMSTKERAEYWIKEKQITKGFTDMGDTHYILRPEAIESLFIMYRITGDPELQDHAWRMFQAIEKATRTDIAHAAVKDVRMATPEQSDRMESFWLAETLKYFYLIFSEPNLLSLDRYVFNTEAHPFKRQTGAL